MPQGLNNIVYKSLTRIICETNGLTLSSTLELLEKSVALSGDTKILHSIIGFRTLIRQLHNDQINENTLLDHPIAKALYRFFKEFPIPYREDHIHLTGSLQADFVSEHLKPLIDKDKSGVYKAKIKEVYGLETVGELNEVEVNNLIRLKEAQGFDDYLRILYLPKLILNTQEMHKKAAYHLATKLYNEHNVGSIRLKFTLSRLTTDSMETIPGINSLSEEDVILGLYEGFNSFKSDHSNFNFVLSPCFRKESSFYDNVLFKSKAEHFAHSIDKILLLRKKHPFLKDCLYEVDTVGNERNLHRKIHFNEMKVGFRKLQNNGFGIRSHHGETWDTLRKGIQSVDNAMNIWRIDVIEHGLSLGINPNFYYHELMQRVMASNLHGTAIPKDSLAGRELMDIDWVDKSYIREKLFKGEKLTSKEETVFIKSKFHLAREVEYYQHDILNRMIGKQISLTTLPSSNKRLTGNFKNYKDHPFSWWEKKGVSLNVGTDNYVTLDTNYIKEMLVMLFTDPDDLKITKLLMVTTGESRRPRLSQLLWKIRRKTLGSE